jgi:hypothetical protein
MYFEELSSTHSDTDYMYRHSNMINILKDRKNRLNSISNIHFGIAVLQKKYKLMHLEGISYMSMLIVINKNPKHTFNILNLVYCCCMINSWKCRLSMLSWLVCSFGCMLSIGCFMVQNKMSTCSNSRSSQ